LIIATNPWLSIPLAEYEGHMASVRQLAALSELFARALDLCRPDSVAILGIAGGNGLEHIDRATITRVVGVDINKQYLDEVQRRFGDDQPLDLHCVDLSRNDMRLVPVSLVHAALFFEHAGVGRALENALALVAPGGHLSVVLQLPARDQPGVSPTPFPSIQTLAADFAFVDIPHFRGSLETRGWELLKEEWCPLSTGKTLWFGLFAGPR
jgi:hypothetical protein